MDSFTDLTTEEWCSLAKITSLSRFHSLADRDFATLFSENNKSQCLQKILYWH